MICGCGTAIISLYPHHKFEYGPLFACDLLIHALYFWHIKFLVLQMKTLPRVYLCIIWIEAKESVERICFKLRIFELLLFLHAVFFHLFLPSLLCWCVYMSMCESVRMYVCHLKGTIGVILNNNVELCGRKIRPIFKCGFKLCSSSENKFANDIQSEQNEEKRHWEHNTHHTQRENLAKPKHLKKIPLKVDEKQIYGRIDWNLG